jgi:predicted metal-dependent phosphoesterase TrpH
MLRVEFHCHTVYSKDSLTRPDELLAACRRKGIQRVAVTDHNTIVGALEAKQLDPQRVIVGEEIMTTRGELLAFYLEEQIPPNLSPQETIQRLRDQEAFISVSHPFDRFRHGAWDERDLLDILPLVDAIETFNARCMLPSFNREAEEFARQHGLPGTVGSDAHLRYEVGRAAQILPEFHDAQSLREALSGAELEVRHSPFWVHFGSRWAVWRKKLNGQIGETLT